jgi:hypothetical protein
LSDIHHFLASAHELVFHSPSEEGLSQLKVSYCSSRTAAFWNGSTAIAFGFAESTDGREEPAVDIWVPATWRRQK